MEQLPLLTDWFKVCARLGLFSEKKPLKNTFGTTTHNPVLIFKLVAHLDGDDQTKLG
jgi:hypothetical protein